MIEITINPSNMSQEQAELLAQLCSKQNLDTLWSARDLHTISANNQDHQIRLTHNVYRKNDGILTCFDSQAELSQVNQVETEPGTAKVYPMVEIEESSASANSNKQGPERVIKAINLKKLLGHFRTREQEKNFINNEIRQANKAGQLAMQLDAVIDDTAYVSMNKAPGRPLNQLLKEDLNNPQRNKLCLAIAKAVQTLLADKNIIHRDLKPDNIFVDMSQQPYLVTILDYGKAIDRGVIPNDTRGTPMYDAPETWLHLGGDKANYYQDNKVDVFALGRIFSRIWDNANFNLYSCHQGNWSEDKKDSLVLDLFDNIVEPPSIVAMNIVCSISMMTNSLPKHRASLDESINFLLAIDAQIQESDATIKNEVREIILNNPSFKLQYKSFLQALDAVENQDKSFITIYLACCSREQSPVSSISLGFTHQKSDPIGDYVVELLTELGRQHAWLKTVKQIVDSKPDCLQRLDLDTWSTLFTDFENDEERYILKPANRLHLINQVVTLAKQTDIKGKTDMALEKFLHAVADISKNYDTQSLSTFIQNEERTAAFSS